MPPNMPSDDQANMRYDNAQLDVLLDSVVRLRTWAIVAASRAKDLAAEWPAISYALTATYILGASFSERVSLLDAAVVIILLWTGRSLRRFEERSAAALGDLVTALGNDFLEDELRALK